MADALSHKREEFPVSRLLPLRHDVAVVQAVAVQILFSTGFVIYFVGNFVSGGISPICLRASVRISAAPELTKVVTAAPTATTMVDAQADKEVSL